MLPNSINSLFWPRALYAIVINAHWTAIVQNELALEMKFKMRGGNETITRVYSNHTVIETIIYPDL
jgi:hypothetical protein